MSTTAPRTSPDFNAPGQPREFWELGRAIVAEKMQLTLRRVLEDGSNDGTSLLVAPEGIAALAELLNDEDAPPTGGRWDVGTEWSSTSRRDIS